MKRLVTRVVVIAAIITVLGGSTVVAADAESQVVVPEWVTKMKINGDIRARFEDVQVDEDTSKSRFRGRVRIGIYGDVNEQMDWGFRLASGSDESPTSSNQSLDDFGSKREIWMDLGYFGWRPADIQDLHLVIGKIKKPWNDVSNLIWDSDFNPEGINAKYSKNGFTAQIGQYLMKDNAFGDDPNEDIGMTSAQLHGGLDVAENVKLSCGIAAFLYQNIKGAEVIKSDAEKVLSNGNTTTDVENEDGSVTKNWANNYEEIDTTVSLDIKRGTLPVKLYGEYVVNIAADSDEDDGWRAGIKGSCFCKRLSVDYNYRDLGRDAVLGVLTDSDFGGGGTGSKGHSIKAKYKALENCTLGLAFLLADNSVKESDVDTLQLDIVVKF